MRIDVVISEWEQACCGASFRIGAEATWRILAADPELGAPGGNPRFLEEHHGETPEDVPHFDVTGIVRAIRGITYPSVPLPGVPYSYTCEPDYPEFTELESVEGANYDGIAEYLVELEVADDVALPTFVLSRDAIVRREARARTAMRGSARMEDPVGRLLEAAADYAAQEYGDVASIARERSRSTVAVAPRLSDATAVRWSRSVDEKDGIRVYTGEGSWRFPATAAHAELVRVFLDAAASGRVIEDVVELRDGAQRLDTCVEAGDGRRWVASTYFEPAVFVGLVSRKARERVVRGRHAYPAWRSPDPL